MQVGEKWYLDFMIHWFIALFLDLFDDFLFLLDFNFPLFDII